MGAVFVPKAINAQQDNSSYPPIINSIAEKFNLNVEDVKGVFDQQRTDRQEQQRQTLQDQINKAVEAGVLTQQQGEDLAGRLNQMAQTRQNQKDELQKWFSDSGIDQTKLSAYIGHYRMHGSNDGFK